MSEGLRHALPQRCCGVDVAKIRFTHSVVTRLVACLVIGGIVLSIGLALLQVHRTEPILRMRIAQKVTTSVNNLHDALRVVLADGSDAEIRRTLEAMSVDPIFVAARVQTVDGTTIASGPWDGKQLRNAAIVTIPRFGSFAGIDIDLERLTFVRAPSCWNSSSTGPQPTLSCVKTWPTR